MTTHHSLIHSASMCNSHSSSRGEALSYRPLGLFAGTGDPPGLPHLDSGFRSESPLCLLLFFVHLKREIRVFVGMRPLSWLSHVLTNAKVYCLWQLTHSKRVQQHGGCGWNGSFLDFFHFALCPWCKNSHVKRHHCMVKNPTQTKPNQNQPSKQTLTPPNPCSSFHNEYLLLCGDNGILWLKPF